MTAEWHDSGHVGHRYGVEYREVQSPSYSVIGAITYSQFRAVCECGFRGRWDDVNDYDVAGTVMRRITLHLFRAGIVDVFGEENNNG